VVQVVHGQRAGVHVVRLDLVVVHGLDQRQHQREDRRHDRHQRHQPVGRLVEQRRVDHLPHDKPTKYSDTIDIENSDSMCLRSKPLGATEAGRLDVRMACSSCSDGDRFGAANTLGARRATIASSIEVTTRGAKRGSALSWAPVGSCQHVP
jgi:hypothetical protein